MGWTRYLPAVEWIEAAFGSFVLGLLAYALLLLTGD
jgi:hypothetical protein